MWALILQARHFCVNTVDFGLPNGQAQPKERIILKRDIGTTNILVAAAGGMIGSGWLFTPFISAQMAGSGALISWIIAAIFMLFIALPLCELGTMFPISGGMSNYPTFTHGKEVGFLFAWVTWLSYVVMTPIEVQAILQYSSHFFPILVTPVHGALSLSAYGYITAIGIMFFVALLNTFGIKMLAECNKYASIFKFLIPSIAITSFLYVSPSFGNIHLDLASKQSWTEIFSALSAGGVVFAFTGFQNGLILAGEVKNPQRNIPIAILGAIGIGFVLYFMLQLSFLAAVPQAVVAKGWQHLSFAGDSGPLVGLALLLGLGTVAVLLLIDAAFSPFGTTLVYTAATSRILYGMALNAHLPKLLLKLNRYKIPYITLIINLLVGAVSFLPFANWQKMVGFLSSASILSYGIGPICLLGMRKLQPNMPRPFKLSGSTFFCHFAFYACNLMLYWCGFEVIWKLYLAVVLGLVMTLAYQRKSPHNCPKSVGWFFGYLSAMFIISSLGTFGGLGWLTFPLDMLVILPLSILTLYWSQSCLVTEEAAHSLSQIALELE